MKFGMNMLLWTADVTEEHFPLIEEIKGWGFDGVELPLFDLNEDKFKAVGKHLESLGMGSTAVTVCQPETNPISPEASIREAAVNHLKKAVDMCALAGATHLCGPIHSALGVFTGAGPTEDEWNYGKETLAKVADYAQSQNVMLTMEYLNRFECYFVNTAEDCARFIREVGHPHLRMMYDTFHANIEEKNIAHAIETCSDVCVHVHISENDRSTPGEGNIDWETNFNTLKETGYDGWMTIEAFGLAMPDLAAATKIWRRMYPSEEHLATKGLEFIKKHV